MKGKVIAGLLIAVMLVGSLSISSFEEAKAETLVSYSGCGDLPNNAILQWLKAITHTLELLDSRLEAVLNTIGPPEVPIPDEIRTEISCIYHAAQSIVDQTELYTGTVLPEPPTDTSSNIQNNVYSNLPTEGQVCQLRSICRSLRRVDKGLANILDEIPPTGEIDSEVKAEFTRIEQNSYTLASRAKAYTGGTTPPPTDTPP